MKEDLRKRIALTADDFGISNEANSNILKLVKIGKIDRVAVIPHGIFTEQDKQQLIESGVKIDVHLNITEDISGTRKIKEDPIKEGASFLLKIFSGKLNNKLVYDNWDRDIKLFIEKFNRNPDGINSHQHVHFFPPYFEITLKLKKHYQIPFIRFGSHAILGKSKTRNVISILRAKNKKRFLESESESTEYLTNLDWIDKVNIFFKDNPKGILEIACHPERKEEFNYIMENF